MKPYFSDSTVTLWHGANLDVLPHLADGSVDCVVTSPPYFGLRDYGEEGQYGAEPTPAEFVANLVATFAEIRRVLANDGTAWLNLGDSYAGSWGAQGKSSGNAGMHRMVPAADQYKHEASRTGAIREGMPPAKNLLGMPWRTAFALQDDGWILRNAICWRKTNPMPEPVKDRLSGVYEMVFLLSKRRSYWFDLDPIRVESTRFEHHLKYPGETYAEKILVGGVPGANNHAGIYGRPGSGMRNPGDVWDIATTPFPGSHFAVFPPEIPRRCILAGCKPGGTVLDPFHGSGTTGMVAQRLGRKYVGIELNKDYLDLSLRTRLADGALPFDEESA